MTDSLAAHPADVTRRRRWTALVFISIAHLMVSSPGSALLARRLLGRGRCRLLTSRHLAQCSIQWTNPDPGNHCRKPHPHEYDLKYHTRELG